MSRLLSTRLELLTSRLLAAFVRQTAPLRTDSSRDKRSSKKCHLFFVLPYTTQAPRQGTAGTGQTEKGTRKAGRAGAGTQTDAG
ncbi:hypothetical protein DXB25_12135 [Lachnospiraceae bacterium OM02-31]|nr:hypothetical protein DXB25_12135 [Lachnospiraceae bacterium OM02-31]RJW59357.1 hypothetical protein DXB24_01490 [Lachnospiraceae bacterium OM02-3]